MSLVCRTMTRELIDLSCPSVMIISSSNDEGIECICCPSLHPYGASCTSMAYFLSLSPPSCVNGHRLYARMRCVRACFEVFNSLNKCRSKGRETDTHTYFRHMRWDRFKRVYCVLLFSIDRSFRKYKQSCQRRTMAGWKNKGRRQWIATINNPMGMIGCAQACFISRCPRYLISLLMESKSFRSESASLPLEESKTMAQETCASGSCQIICSIRSMHRAILLGARQSANVLCLVMRCVLTFGSWRRCTHVENWIECQARETEMTRHLSRLEASKAA